MKLKHKICAVSIAILLLKKKKRFRSQWSRQWLLKRTELSHINLVNELRMFPHDFLNYLRMSEETYLELLALISPLVLKKDTVMRKAISPHERLSATLRFLATGRSYEDLKFSTLISPSALSKIIPETCTAIIKALSKDYMKFPTTEMEWKAIAKDFENKWQFPHCLGAVDGKHVRIEAPPNSGSYFWNYKGYNSIVLLAISNANYEFILCDVGTNGRVSDGGVIEYTDFYYKLKNELLSIPPPEKVNKSDVNIPYVFIGDEAFALRKDFLTPFSRNILTNERRTYNYRLSRARRVVENAFGIMTSRFRIFHTAIHLKLENIDRVVMACCILHNFLRSKAFSYTSEELDFDTDTCPSGLKITQNKHSSEQNKQSRDTFLKYFSNEGAVSWQNDL